MGIVRGRRSQGTRIGNACKARWYRRRLVAMTGAQKNSLVAMRLHLKVPEGATGCINLMMRPFHAGLGPNAES